MANNLVTGIKLENNPPRPMGESGEIAVPFGESGQEVILKWDGGRIVDVIASENGNAVEISRMQIQSDPEKTLSPETLGLVTCFKCARDSTTGQMVCWDVPC